MPQPTSSETQTSSLWSRRNLILTAVVLALPFLGGIVEVHLFNLSPGDGRKYWSGVSWTAQWEVIIAAAVLQISFMFPSLRNRLGLPNIHGDERERKIAEKASNFSFVVSIGILTTAAIALVLVAGEERKVEIPVLAPIWACFAIMLSNYGSMIYYSRKL